jgi:OOP family OmpA-OmpF porin
MKKILFTVLTLGIVSVSVAQTGNVSKKTLGIHITFHDFATASQMRSKGISDVLYNKQWSKGSRVKKGLAVSYTEGLTENIDFNARLGMSFVENTLQNQSSVAKVGQKPYFESDANLFMKLTSDAYYVSPFISLGAGASLWQGYYSAYVPVGLGLKLNVFDQTSVTLQTQYRMPVTANTNFHLFYSIGIAGRLGK